MNQSSSHNTSDSKSLFENRFKTLKAKGGGWTPVWRGLVIDNESKHRKAIGSSVWVFLFLIFNAQHSSGIVRKTAKNIAELTGFSPRSVNRHISRLVAKDYITILESRPILVIRIHKWKTFSNRRN